MCGDGRAIVEQCLAPSSIQVWCSGSYHGCMRAIFTVGIWEFTRIIQSNCLLSRQEVFVNFPEPPVWEGSKWRLLDAQLFAAVHKVLSPGGMLHILTDDEALCKYVKFIE